MINGDTKCMDKVLANRVNNGDKSAFRQLYKKYYPVLLDLALYKVGDGNLAEDFTQDVFAWLWDRRKTWRPKQSVKAYLSRALSNRIMTHFRKKNVEQPIDFNECPEKTHPKLETEEDDYKQEVHLLLKKHIKVLPKRRRAVLYLFMYHGLTYKEISSELDISVNTVDMQLRRVRKGVINNEKISKYYSALNSTGTD